MSISNGLNSACAEPVTVPPCTVRTLPSPRLPLAPQGLSRCLSAVQVSCLRSPAQNQSQLPHGCSSPSWTRPLHHPSSWVPAPVRLPLPRLLLSTLVTLLPPGGLRMLGRHPQHSSSPRSWPSLSSVPTASTRPTLLTQWHPSHQANGTFQTGIHVMPSCVVPPQHDPTL